MDDDDKEEVGKEGKIGGDLIYIWTHCTSNGQQCQWRALALGGSVFWSTKKREWGKESVCNDRDHLCKVINLPNALRTLKAPTPFDLPGCTICKVTEAAAAAAALAPLPALIGLNVRPIEKAEVRPCEVYHYRHHLFYRQISIEHLPSPSARI